MILALTELLNAHVKKQYESKSWITSAVAKDKHNKSTDPAAGVAIMILARMTNKILASGHIGARIVWVRLSGPVCNLFVVAAYIPHKGRSNPCASDVIEEIKGLLKGVNKSDCIILCGDFNCQLQRHVEGCTGKWCMTTKPDNGHGNEVLDLMRCYDLFAVDTLFKPARKTWPSSKRKRISNATYLPKDKTRRPTKLEYICVSNRWKSMTINSTVRWEPSLHRFGQKFDHGLLSATWRWRTRKETPRRWPDFGAMDSQSWRSFDSVLQMKLQKKTDQPQVTEDKPGVVTNAVTIRVGKDKTKVDYKRISTCVQETIREVVPTKKKVKKHRIQVSNETQDLFEQRKAAFTKNTPTKQERKEWNKKIKNRCRDDYREWVARWVQEIERADEREETPERYTGAQRQSVVKQAHSQASNQP